MNAKELVKTIKYLEINTNRKVNEIFAGNYRSSFRGQGLEVSDLRNITAIEEGENHAVLLKDNGTILTW